MPSGSNRQTPSAAAASAFAARFNRALAIALPQSRAAECRSRSACRCQSRLQLRVPGAARCSTPRGRGAGACTSSWRSRRLSLQAALWCAPRVHVDAASSNSREFRWRDGKLFSRTGLRSVRENNFHRKTHRRAVHRWGDGRLGSRVAFLPLAERRRGTSLLLSGPLERMYVRYLRE